MLKKRKTYEQILRGFRKTQEELRDLGNAKDAEAQELRCETFRLDDLRAEAEAESIRAFEAATRLGGLLGDEPEREGADGEN